MPIDRESDAGKVDYKDITVFRDAFDEAIELLKQREKGESKTPQVLGAVEGIAKRYYGDIRVPAEHVKDSVGKIIFLPASLDGRPGIYPILWANGSIEDTA